MADEQLSAHDAAMVAKVDAASKATDQAAGIKPEPSQPNAAPQRPEHVPEKFWDAAKGQVNTEALLKSYGELEKGKAATPAADPPKPADGDPAAAAAAKAVTDAKLDMNALSAEVAANGELSEASYEALAKVGFDKDTVNTFIAGQQALATQRDNQGFELAGGKDQFIAMAKWAQANLSADEQSAFDTAVQGTPAQMKQAILSLRTQYQAANGSNPTLIQGGGGNGSGSEGAFASRAEVTAAMRDPKYKADPAYRAEVERRIGLMEVF
jgi:hypothetical protein